MASTDGARLLRCGPLSHEPIKVGILLPTRDAVMSGRFEVAPLLAMAEQGRYWSLSDARLLPTPHRAAGPPIWMGGEAIALTQGFHAGDPPSCLERLQGFVTAGVRHIVLRFGGGDQAAQLERTTREILPRLKG